MKVLEAIFKRRSVRHYTNQAIRSEDITRLLQAAMAAPTARNCQEWEFVVVRDKAMFKKIMAVHPYSKMLAEADCAIVVCGNTKREMAPGYWQADCGAATQNILLAATALGIGSVWLGVYPNEERMAALARLLNLPEYVKPLNIISLGMPAEKLAEVNRFDPAKIHYELW